MDSGQLQIGQPPKWTRFVPGKLRGSLVSPKGRLTIIYVQLYAIVRDTIVFETQKDKYKLPSSRNRIESQVTTTRVRKPSSKRNSYEWHWRDFPPMHPSLVWARVITTIYFVYILIKYTMSSVAEYIAEALGLSKPAHCYLLGRFFIYDQPNGSCAACFAYFHLFSRLLSPLNPPVAISTLNFLVLDDHDILLYYELIEAFTKATNPGKYFDELREVMSHYDYARFQMMHDIMGVTIDYGSARVPKVRPNRTKQACEDLRNFLIGSASLGAAVFALVVCSVTTLLLTLHVNDQSYLNRYPKCDTYLEQLHRSGLVPADRWSFHLTRNVLVCSIFDALENLFLWLESGLSLFTCVILTLVLNYDLIVYWNHLDRKIELLLEFSRLKRMCPRRDQGCSVDADESVLSSSYDQSIYELLQEICDFIKHLRRTNEVVGDMLSTVTKIWFVVFAFIIYNITSHQQKISAGLNVILMFVFFVTSVLCVLATTVHRNCLKSYGKICSLMCEDDSCYKNRFVEILDYFVCKRTCYTIYRTYAMTTTSYLTIVGYSVSCFFVLGSG
jgi:hypothetical protein